MSVLLRRKVSSEEVDPTSSAVAVLTAMITPAVLISACGSMILSTSSRLGRVVDRVRALSDRLEELARSRADEARERQAVAEMDYTWRLTTRVAPADVVELHKPHFVHFRSHK